MRRCSQPSPRHSNERMFCGRGFHGFVQHYAGASEPRETNPAGPQPEGCGLSASGEAPAVRVSNRPAGPPACSRHEKQPTVLAWVRESTHRNGLHGRNGPDGQAISDLWCRLYFS